MTRRILAVFFGVLGVLLGISLLAGATWLLFEDRDADGFYATEIQTLERPSHAIVSGDFDQLTEVPSWFADIVTDPVDELRPKADAAEDLQGRGGYLVSSCRRTELAAELKEEKRGAFTHHLTEGIKSGRAARAGARSSQLAPLKK